MSHTPGPWTWDKYRNTLSSPSGAVIDSAPYEGMYLSPNNEEEDARLIAAAPDLLEFAEYCLEMDPDSTAPLFMKARAVIAKAKV